MIESDSVGADCDSFPVCLTEDNFPAEMFAGGDHPALHGGGDLRFSWDSAGSQRVGCDIIKWDSTNSKAELYVPRDLLDASDVGITVWYHVAGKSQPAADAAYGSESVWNNDYVAVYHMQRLAGSAPHVADATGNNNDGTNNGVVVTGVVPNAISDTVYHFTGDVIITDSSTSLLLDGDLTVSVWGRSPTTADNNQTIAFLEMLNTEDEINNWSLIFWAQPGLDIQCRHETGAGIDVNGPNEDHNFTANAWHHIACTRDTATDEYATFADLSELSTNYTADSPPTHGARIHQRLSIGNRYSLGLDWVGQLDELRIANVKLSVDWLAVEYSNTATPAAFAIEGTPYEAEVGEAEEVGWIIIVN